VPREIFRGSTAMAAEERASPADHRGATRSLRLLRAAAWLVALGAGFLEAWAARFSMSPDGTCYLDIASAYLRHDWNTALNAYWSPLFSWLLAATLWVFRPSAYWESTLLHLLNFLAMLASLRSFEFLFRELLRLRAHFGWNREGADTLSEWNAWILGYGLFLSTTLFVLSTSLTMPDLWVSVLVYLAVGLILKIWRTGGSTPLFLALGFVLGLAYLAKTFYFPMAFVFLLTAVLARGGKPTAIRQALAGLASFALLAGPWAGALSRAKGRPTFGDVGKVAVAITMDQIPEGQFFWQGQNDTGTPKHSVRQLLARPRLYEFGYPVGGSYPLAYDPSYWMEGVKPHFYLPGLVAVLRQSAGTFLQFLTVQTEYLVGLLFLLFLARGREWLVQLRKQALLWIPPLLGCAGYAVVLVEGRYDAPFLLLLWLAAFSSLFAAATQPSARMATALILAMISVTGVRIAKSGSSDLLSAVSHSQNVDWEVAESLRGLGIKPGDQVAGLFRVAEAQWARIARVKIVSEIPLGEEYAFWTADPETKLHVFKVFGSTGARVLVTKDVPLPALKEGWIPLGKTRFFAHALP